MSSRHSAARPKRAGEAFARVHHGDRDRDDDGGSSKKVKFDVRNPSALAADAREDDDVLDADVIGTGGGLATKRGAVNIDGYDSDSDNETFNARANAKGDKPVNILDQLDNYDSKTRGDDVKKGRDDDDDDDMFAEEPDEDAPANKSAAKSGRKGKEVHFLDNDAIEGQELTSRSGGQVRLDDENDSSEEAEEEEELVNDEDGVDEEVGAGGLKRNAPKIDAFNMRSEQEEGAFDEAGNFIRKAADADDVHDMWLVGIKKKDMKEAAAAHEKREAELRQQRKEEDSIMTSSLIRTLVLHLDKGETPLEALARLAKAQNSGPKAKRIPKWKLKKQQQSQNGAAAGAGDADPMAIDSAKETGEDAEQNRVKASISAITEAADRLLGRDYQEIYDTERELLIREYRNETGEEWVEPSHRPQDSEGNGDAGNGAASANASQWEFRWTDGRDDAAKQGPFDTAAMQAWHAAGFFSEGVEFRPAGSAEEWTRIAPFL